MKIQLEAPFKELYKSGYLVINSENRRNIILYNSEENRTTISYARYLMSVKLNSIIDKEYEVDHIDGDKTNDFIENLQLLHYTIHKKKTGLEVRKQLKHGTLSGYRYCKCIFCKEGNRVYHSKGKEAYKDFIGKL